MYGVSYVRTGDWQVCTLSRGRLSSSDLHLFSVLPTLSSASLTMSKMNDEALKNFCPVMPLPPVWDPAKRLQGLKESLDPTSSN